MDLKPVLAEIDRSFERDVQEVLRYIRQPSISALNVGISDMAQLVASSLEELGASVQICATAGHPIVFGELDTGAPLTLLIYGMYDVQPANESNWSVPPFEGGVLDMSDLGQCIVGRGATNSKGPLVGTLNAMRAYQRANQPLPLNFIFMVEGEEELGSRSLPAFMLGEHRTRLQRANGALFPAFRQNRQGKAGIQLGTKGLLYFELTCRGGDWGGPRDQGIHGAYAAWIGSPVWRLVKALSSMMDEREGIQIAHFFDDVRAPSPDEETLLAQLSHSFDREGVLRENAVARFKWAGSDVDLLRHYLYDPTLNIDGIIGGYTEPGTKTQLPDKVMVKIDIRMVPDMDAERVMACVRKHLDERGYGDIEIGVLNCYPWSQLGLDEPVVQALISTYEALGAPVEIWARNVGSAPLYLFKEQLGIPYVMGGMGHGERAHSNNELCTLEGLRQFERSIVTFFDHYSSVARR